MPPAALRELYRRPGFMIRRAHQIASSVFLEETQQLRITPTQYGVLYLLKHVPHADQISIANLLGFDRSTTSLVVQKLEATGLVVRQVDAEDRRRKYLKLTKAGDRTLRELAVPVRRSLDRLLAVFDETERETFLKLLEKFTGAFNKSTRVPIRGPVSTQLREDRRAKSGAPGIP